MAKAQTQVRDIGIDVAVPKASCDDPNCPFHGHLKVRGQLITGQVATRGMQGSVIVERDYTHYAAKYERFEKRSSRLAAHLPRCLADAVAVGDWVRIGECRPISKTKSYVVLERRESA